MFAIGRITMSEASHSVTHSVQYLMSISSSCRHRESYVFFTEHPGIISKSN